MCIAEALFQIKLPKNRESGAVNHGTTPQRKTISSYLLCHSLLSDKAFRKGWDGVWLAQSAERATLDLRVMSSSPMMGVEPS